MNIDELKSHALAARREIVTMIYESGIGHPGGALSIIDVLTWLYYQEVDLAAFPRSRVVMSKGHAVAAQYAMLYQQGKIERSEFNTFRQINSACRGTRALSRCRKSMRQPDCLARGCRLLLVWRPPKSGATIRTGYLPSLAMAKCMKAKSGKPYSRPGI